MTHISSTLLARLCTSPESLTTDERNLIAETAYSGSNQKTSLLITQKEAALLLGVDRTTVWRLVHDGIIIPVEILPGTNRYRRQDIDQLARHGWQQFVAARRDAA